MPPPSNPLLDDEASLLRPLNEAQREAVCHLEGPLLVLAGAGSGKTRVITHRVAYMIRKGVGPTEILAVTFTNKAAREMQARILALTGSGSVRVSTFHAFAARFLRQEFPGVGRPAEFTIYDDHDVQILAKHLIEEFELDPVHYPPAELRRRISSWKTRMQGPQELLLDHQGSLNEVWARLYERYEETLEEANACDFDDLLLKAAGILQQQPQVLARWRQKITRVLVDEFQDTNASQYALVRLLCAENRNLCVTGDPDQSIYSWRGADPGSFDRFLTDFPEARTVPLEQNYRSTGNILKTASKLIAHNCQRIQKTLWSAAGEGETVRVVAFPDDIAEARAVVQALKEWENEGFARGRMAVFYRANSLSLPVERMLMQAGLPYQVVGGLEFFARQEVKDLLSWLRFLQNPRDRLALLRILNLPPRGIGKKTQAQVVALASAQGRILGEWLRDPAAFKKLKPRARSALQGFSEILHDLDRLKPESGVEGLLLAILERTGYKKHWAGRSQQRGALDPYQNLGQLVTFAAEFDQECDGGTGPFLERVALFTDLDRMADGAETLSLLTLHSSKGLEFDAVIIIGLEEGLLPHQMSAREPGGLEEERRLLHVGMTRARRRLVLTHARQRTRFGRAQRGVPSTFLDEIGSEGVEFFGDPELLERDGHDLLAESEADASHPLAWLRKGNTVRHPEWGLGIVTRIRGRGSPLDRKADILFQGEQRRTLILRHAELEIVEDFEIDGI